MIQEKRPIDANSLYDIIEARYKNATGEAREKYREVLDLICDQPTLDLLTADVAPKSEVERLRNALMGECSLTSCPLKARLKAEITREVFAEIESWDLLDGIVAKYKFAQLKKKFDPICDQET